MSPVDAVIIGAGVIGLAVGRALANRGQDVVVIESAPAIGTGTSSRNSGVIHAGLYYPTGSLKARLCVTGRQLLYRYCEAKGIGHRRTGKLILATSDDEVPILEKYLAGAQANGVDDLRWVEPAEVAQLEPELRAVRALLSPSTGIIDSHEYLLALQADLEAKGGQVALNSHVTRVGRTGDGFAIFTSDAVEPAIRCRRLINAAGLHAPGVAATIEGLQRPTIPRQYLARGHYYTLAGRSPFRRLVYPVAETGGLGIHVTLDLAGAARFGPDVQWRQSVDYSFDGDTRRKFTAAIRRYYPALDDKRLQPGYTGIRAKLSGPGEPAADFLIQATPDHRVPGLVNLYGIESPGLTAALAIAEEVAAVL
ncbi:MAG: NAD(P)/FAD-dependent oxidoreductase [Chromatiales bacterium]|nr:NAD(P)/FAD-dependent oxidoreductase [Chromatiales bacterium]